jgi:hypothetical protein
MKLLFLFICLFCSDKDIYIVVDNSTQSKIIKSELSRDWTAGNSVNISDIAYKIEDKKCLFSESLILVDRDNIKLCREHGVLPLSRYPQFRVGRYSEFNEFDNRSFLASGSAVMTILAIKHNADVDMWDYNKKCEQLSREAKYTYINDILIWGQTNAADDINRVYFFSHNDDFDDIIDKYKAYKDFPTLKKPILPKSPIEKFPWEKP